MAKIGWASQFMNNPAPPTAGGYFSGYTPKQYTGKFSVQGLDKPLTGRHYTGVIMDDLVDPPYHLSHQPSARKCFCTRCMDARLDAKVKVSNKSKKEVKMSEDKSYEYQKLYQVVTTYGEDRNDVIVKRTDVVAETEERARMQVSDDIESDWDLDYVSQDVEVVAEIRIKVKPRETKEVVK